MGAVAEAASRGEGGDLRVEGSELGPSKSSQAELTHTGRVHHEPAAIEAQHCGLRRRMPTLSRVGYLGDTQVQPRLNS